MRDTNVELPRSIVVLTLWLYAILMGGALAFVLGFIRPFATFPAIVSLVCWLTQLLMYPALIVWRGCLSAERPIQIGFGFWCWAGTATVVSAVVFLALRVTHG